MSARILVVEDEQAIRFALRGLLKREGYEVELAEDGEAAIRVLDKACDYLERHEPSSPVPLLLKRAKRLVSKNFMEIMRDLAPDGVAQAQVVSGADGEGSAD